MKLAIEMNDGLHTDAYGMIHRAECRDLHDPEPIGDARSRAEIPQLVENATGWGLGDDDVAYYLANVAPCVTLA